MDIVEGNKLIAQFMGYTYYGFNDERLKFERDGKSCTYEPGWKKGPRGHPNTKNNLGGYLCRNHHQLRYHFDWSALMPVVENIESLSVYYAGETIKYFEFEIRKKYCLIQGHSGIRQPGCYYQTPYGFEPISKINAIWIACVEFIKWYNSI